MKRLHLTILAIFMTLLLCGCSPSMMSRMVPDEVLNFVGEYYQLVSEGDFEGAALMYSDEFYKTGRKANTQARWTKLLKEDSESLGVLQKYSMTGFNTEFKFGSNASHHYTLTYLATYSLKTVTDTFLIYKTRKNGPYKIQRHVRVNKNFNRIIKKAVKEIFL